MADKWDWVDKQEEVNKEAKSKGYFDIKEGKQQFMLLSHCAPFPQVYAGGKYRPAEEGDKDATIRGVCWVLQDGLIKQAKLPYTLVRAIRGYQQDPEWEFQIPFPHMFTLEAIGAGTKEVKYTLTPSPKKSEIPAAIFEELEKKPTPEEMVERLKGKTSAPAASESPIEYPEEDIRPENIPF